MQRKKRSLKYKKERAVLSDVLPYELPITFSNRHFYEFLLSNKIEYINDNIEWHQDDLALDTIIKLLCGLSSSTGITETNKKVFDKNIIIKSFVKNDIQNKQIKTPFGYKINHKENEYRELVVCHPLNQLQLVNFYHSYKELILYYCKISPFSIRRPHKISKFVFHKDKTHYDILSEESVSIEEINKEYENLRSFFVYKDYSNIHKFYESYKYQRCEKKYNKLLKLDISKCFDSIYTHSLTWALLNKESVKENIGQSNDTFAGKFDKFMQQLNYNETNGIIIGPEFSRIFAELILQSVDRDVCLTLQNKPYDHHHKKDYEIFRYVDDYFIFYNQEKVKDDILQVLQLKLKDYKLYLNNTKAKIYEKPLITEISMAKNRIAKLLSDKLAYKIEHIESEPLQINGTISINSNSLITQFKTIIKECDVQYKDMLNYSLSIVEKQSTKIIKDYSTIDKKDGTERQLIKAVIDILDFTFFIYSVSPRVNTTIKLCRVLRVFTLLLKRKEANADFKHLVFKLIYDNICFTLKKNKNSEHIQVETLYLLIALSELGKDYWLDENSLCDYFEIDKNTTGYKIKPSLNYLSLTVLLFYMKNKKRFGGLRTFIEESIIEKFKQKANLLYKDTELTLLLFDCLTCPYIQTATKRTILLLYGVQDEYLQDSIIHKRKYWFTKWTDFDFGKELDSKHSQEVY